MVAELRLTAVPTRAALPPEVATASAAMVLPLQPAALCDLRNLNMPARPKADWAAIRADYEADILTVTEITDKYHVSGPTLYDHAERENWTLRHPARLMGRKVLVKRLMAMLERQVAHLEARMTGSDDNEVALLGHLARTLEKLVALDNKEETPKPDDKRRRDIDLLRQKLADRIEQLRDNQP